MSIDKKEPLISVIVITYNSSATVIETLESVYKQTYQRVELIIADDKSHDNTVEICESWLKDHQIRFERTMMIVPPENTGTAGNCNRGCKAARGEWLKLIAADDLLLDNCLEKLYDFTVLNHDARLVIGKAENFGVEIKGYDHVSWQHNYKLYNILETAEEQHWYLMHRNFIAAMGAMMQKTLWEEVGGYDEECPLIEDWPFWLKVTAAGHKIYFTDDIVAKYRLTTSSVRSTNYLYAYNIKLVSYKWIYGREKAFKRIKKMSFLKKKSLLSALVYRLLDYTDSKYRIPW